MLEQGRGPLGPGGDAVVTGCVRAGTDVRVLEREDGSLDDQLVVVVIVPLREGRLWVGVRLGKVMRGGDRVE